MKAFFMRDDNESTGLFEPVLIAEETAAKAGLHDLALELAQRSEGLRRSLPECLADSLADLVRSMNCYYSNLIEGHNTHPVDIERALRGDYSEDTSKRNLQLEAKAHIAVQKWIDGDGLKGSPFDPANIADIHRRFCELLPDELLWVEDPTTGDKAKVVPGELRDRDVKVGQLIAISPGAVPRFLERLHQAYRPAGKINAILASACGHHRLLWVHPFIDGNGRVTRLVSYALLRQTLDTNGLWSVARGLARQQKEYKAHLASCDQPRRNDLDGRGTLSEEALVKFATFFLKVCIDQVAFMEDLMRPAKLTDRIMIWAEEQIRTEVLPPKADVVLKALLYRGELSRGEIAGLIGSSDRSARRVTSALIESGAASSESTRAPIRLAFPAKYADRWMPGLFPEA